MFSGKINLSTYSQQNMVIWFIMAFQAGTLNTGGFLACHRFVTHTTGFATLFGSEIAQGHLTTAIGIVTVPIFFLVGNILSAYLVDRRINLHLKPYYTAVFFLMFSFVAIIFTLGQMNFFGDFGGEVSIAQDYTLLALLCLTSGLQNATVTSASGAVVRTTHLTGITTDLGIGITRLFSRAYRKSRNEEIKANWMRIGIISSFILGSWISASIFIYAQYGGFIIPLIICALLTYLSHSADKQAQEKHRLYNAN